MRVENWPIDKVTPYENNPRKNDDAVEYVANSIKEFGFRSPIIVDRNGVIICGHTRLKAALSLGLTEVPVHVADNLTDEQVRAYRLTDNKTGEFAEWDFPMLNEELEGIDWLDIDMQQFGFKLDDELFGEDGQNSNIEESKSLQERFGVVPFSVLYANRGDWIERKRKWVALGIRSEIGRGGL